MCFGPASPAPSVKCVVDDHPVAEHFVVVLEQVRQAQRDCEQPGQSAATSLDGKRIAGIVGTPGSLKDGVYKIVIGRTIAMGEHNIGKEMGVNTWAAFAGSDELAVVDGDFAMLESEVQGVLKALRAGGINIVAIHNHMTFENPRMVFLHYWGIGSTTQLAQTLRAALSTQHLD